MNSRRGRPRSPKKRRAVDSRVRRDDAFSRILAGESFATYEQFARDAGSSRRRDDYLFSDEEVRFKPRANDELALMSGTELLGDAPARLRVGGIELPLGVPLDLAQRFVAALHRGPTLSELERELSREAIEPALDACFGKVLFVPQAMKPLEAAMSGVEVVRFPGSPYEIDRDYWANMGDARAHFRGIDPASLDLTGFKHLLRELHLMILAGRRLDSFYFPASPAARRGVAPGRFHESPTKLTGGVGSRIIEQGLRINASLFGSPSYHRAIHASVDDLESTADEVLQEEGRHGRVVLARSRTEADAKCWFVPPPLTDEHFAELLAALQRAFGSSPKPEEAPFLDSVALVHQLFVRLHPFRCANQSIAMTIVNSLLGDRLGTGIPHLLLDHFALRMRRDAYGRLFARAVANYVLPTLSVAQRYQQLGVYRTLQYQLVHRLGELDEPRIQRVVEAADVEALRASLLC